MANKKAEISFDVFYRGINFVILVCVIASQNFKQDCVQMK